jgi:general secretion pathway protein C
MNFLFSGLQRLTHHQAKWWKWALIIVSTYFLAKSLSRILAGLLFPLELPEEPGSSKNRVRSSDQKLPIALILDRNLFDSKAKEARSGPGGPVDINSQDLRPSTMAADLLGTLDFQNEIFSAGLIRDRSANLTQFYRKGERLQDAEIVKIERQRVIVQRAGRLEYLEIQGAKTALNPSLSTRPGSSKPGGEDVRQIEDNRFEVSGASLQQYLSDPSLYTSARAIPHTDSNGRIVGFKIVDMQESSVFRKLGMQRGDIIKRVNGDDVNGIDKVMQLVTTLQNEKRIAIDIERNGVGVNYIYDIR